MSRGKRLIRPVTATVTKLIFAHGARVSRAKADLNLAPMAVRILRSSRCSAVPPHSSTAARRKSARDLECNGFTGPQIARSKERIPHLDLDAWKITYGQGMLGKERVVPGNKQSDTLLSSIQSDVKKHSAFSLWHSFSLLDTNQHKVQSPLARPKFHHLSCPLHLIGILPKTAVLFPPTQKPRATT